MMKKYLCRTSALLLFAFVSFQSASLFAQKDGSVENLKKFPRYMRKIKYKNGWQIPDIGRSKLISEETVSVKGKQVSQKIYKPEYEAKYGMGFATLTINKKIASILKMTDIVSFTTYSVNDSTFAYRLDTKELDTVKGEEFIVFYLDENGDGKFETQYLHRDELPLIPKWTKSNKKKAGKKS